MVDMPDVVCIVPAAGSSRRVGLEDKKQFLSVGGRPMLLQTVRRLESSGVIDLFVVAVADEDRARAAALLQGFSSLVVVTGGSTRQETVYHALGALPSSCRWVVVHDAARPWVEPALVRSVLSAAAETGAAIAAVRASDTLKIVDDRGIVESTLPRDSVRLVQTPQAFDRRLLERSHAVALERGWVATDDATLVELLDQPVAVVQGSPENAKVTWPSDLCVEPLGAVRVGLGYDAHRFASERTLVLGGVEIPGSPGLAGHSDADVLLHAIMDALLGAAALGDIGDHFPPGSPRFAGACSGGLLRRVVDLLAESGYRPHSVDAIVVAQQPRLAPYRGELVASISSLCQLEPGRVSVKATTTEGMGFMGRCEGMAAYSVATILKT